MKQRKKTKNTVWCYHNFPQNHYLKDFSQYICAEWQTLVICWIQLFIYTFNGQDRKENENGGSIKRGNSIEYTKSIQEYTKNLNAFKINLRKFITHFQVNIYCFCFWFQVSLKQVQLELFALGSDMLKRL